MIKYISLFSGIGGFELGIQAASKQTGIKTECVFASEIDKSARIIYTKNFGGGYLDDDITKINATDVPEHDLAVFGFPCQDVSVAGKREGLCGARSSLFFEAMRIIREKKPRYLLIENVKGILSSNGGWDFARILIELEDAGYASEWEVRNTKTYLPQNRERVYIIGHLAGPERSGTQIFPIRKSEKPLSGKEPTVDWLDANYRKGVAQQPRTMVLCDAGQGRQNQIREEAIAPLRANTGAAHNNIICHSTLPRSSKSGKGGTGHLSKTDGSTYCLDANNNLAVEYHENIRRLTPTEAELLQGFPRDWTAGVADTNRYRCLGNAVTVPVVADIVKGILKAMTE